MASLQNCGCWEGLPAVLSALFCCITSPMDGKKHLREVVNILCYPAQAASRSQLLGVTATVVFLNSIVPVGPPACGKNSAFFDDSVPSALEVIPGGPA